LPDVAGVEDMEQVNGEYSLSFVCFNTKNNQYAYPLVQEESTVELDGHEFRIKQMTEVRDRKEVHAQHIFFDLVDHYQEGTYAGTHTLDEFVIYALNGTGWTFENVDVTESAFIPNFGEGNVVALIRQICDAFGCEYQIMPGRHLRFMKQIGADKDEQFRYKHNIKTIKKSVDTTKLATAIKGYGANGLVVEYHSPNEAIYGTRWAEPIKDERYTIAESLLERLKQELVDVPEVSIELELSQLGFDVELGDRVWVIYEPLGIDFQTRVMEIKRYPFSKRSPVVTLSNKKRVFTDILTETKVDIEENKKETRSKFEQTNERITLEVERIDESIATLQIEADNIVLSVQQLSNRLDEEIQAAYSQIDIKANGVLIESKAYTDDVIDDAYNYFDGRIESVESSIDVIAGTVALKASVQYVDQQIGNVYSEVNELDSRIQSAESQLTVQANQIATKVSYSDYNGNEIASRINQTATTVTIEASKINLDGITRVNSTLRIGDPLFDSGGKTILFRSDASIESPANTSALNIEANDYLYLYGSRIYFRSYYGGGAIVDLSSASNVIYGSNVPYSVQYANSAGNADTLDGYHASAFSFSGHVHSDYEYVKPSSGQAIRLGIYTTGQRLNLYLNGSLVGYIPYTPA
jgi:phage minor structural protein